MKAIKPKYRVRINRACRETIKNMSDDSAHLLVLFVRVLHHKSPSEMGASRQEEDGVYNIAIKPDILLQVRNIGDELMLISDIKWPTEIKIVGDDDDKSDRD